jgi:hypothetical protein
MTIAMEIPAPEVRHTGIPVLAVGGLATALGSLGVTITSALYALSPPAAATPMQPFDQPRALAAAVSGAATLHAAGTVGILSDLVLATGALLVGLELARRGRGIAAAGWIAILLSVVIFTFVDTLVGYVLTPVAAGVQPEAAFIGFKLLFDTLFLLGTIAFGIGAALAMASEYQEPALQLSRRVALSVVITGLAGVAAALGCLLRLPLALAVGVSIGLGSALFVIVGAQIARTALVQQSRPQQR